MAEAQYVRFYLRSGQVIEVTSLTQYNGISFPSGEAVKNRAEPGMTYVALADGRRFYIREDDILVIEFGPNTPVETERPVAMGFKRPE
ncbi:MAG: hypothetical protein WD557_14090 [Dehalococcoidia bacterium]